MIYFIQCGPTGPIKIGKAVDPEARLRALQTGNPERLRLLGTVPGGHAREGEIHAQLAAFRTDGEWFAPHETVLAYVRDLLSIMPEYRVQDGRAYAVLRRPDVRAPCSPCPFCAELHVHGEGDGHRVPHCVHVTKPEISSGDVVLRQRDGYLVITT